MVFAEAKEGVVEVGAADRAKQGEAQES